MLPTADSFLCSLEQSESAGQLCVQRVCPPPFAVINPIIRSLSASTCPTIRVSKPRLRGLWAFKTELRPLTTRTVWIELPLQLPPFDPPPGFGAIHRPGDEIGHRTFPGTPCEGHNAEEPIMIGSPDEEDDDEPVMTGLGRQKKDVGGATCAAAQ
ncbi:hypothetical protein FRC09_003324 [Ceratobasidium sp. 395]|nr:hypothetical protein FRC09_003324 [Ceratobasidium sp. 395]